MRLVHRKLSVGKPCPVQGKRKYRSDVDALIDHATNPRHIRAYLCPHCGFFHVSSQPKRSAA